MNLFVYITFLFLILCMQIITPQNAKWVLLDTTNSPLPVNSINCLEIDKDNVKWIGTDKGVVKFDGTNWEEYTKTNSPFSGYFVSSIAVDSLNNKWIGTDLEGLNFFDGENWKLYTNQNSGLPSDIINTIRIDKSNRKYIGTSFGAGPGGFAIFNDTTWNVFNTANSNFMSDMVTAFAFDSNDNLWVGFGGYFVEGDPQIHDGVAEYANNKWTHYTPSDTGFSSFEVNDILVDNKNKLWFATNYKINTFDGEKWQYYLPAKDSTIYPQSNCFVLDNDNNIWIGAGSQLFLGGALIKYNGADFTIFDTSNSILPSGYINDIDIDKYNNIWISVHGYWDRAINKTYGGGLVIYNPDGVTGIMDIAQANIEGYYLSQNYPNPFNPVTTFKYSIPKTGIVTIKIFDVLGKEIRTLLNEEKSVGTYKVEFNVSNLTSGIYLYRMQSGNFRETKKLILLK